MSDHSDKEKDNQLDDKKYKDEKIEKESQVTLEENRENHRIHLITIIGEIEGHENAVSLKLRSMNYYCHNWLL